MLNRRDSLFASIAALTALGLGFVLSLVAAPLAAEDETLPLRFSAIAVNMGNVGPRGSARLDIAVDRWSTDEERATLLAALKEKGVRSLTTALGRQEPVGRIREIQGLGYDLRYSRMISVEGGQQILLATDRPLGFAEVWRGSRTRDYNVTLVVLDLDAEGSGEGQLMLGAEFSWNEEKNQIVIEHLSSEPIRLTTVQPR